MIVWTGQPYRFTEEDERVLESLTQAGFLDKDQPFNVLEVVNAARTFERARIIDNIDRLPAAERVLLTNFVIWLTLGAPDSKREA
jgi:hypothetical protein